MTGGHPHSNGMEEPKIGPSSPSGVSSSNSLSQERWEYDKVITAIQNNIAAIQMDLEFLGQVKADPGLITELQGETVLLDNAIEIIGRYRDLDL